MPILVTGGARSGKSGFAEALARKMGTEGIYIATCQALDGEMAERIKRHREDRARESFAWTTIEEPLLAAEVLDRLAAADRSGSVVLLDCVTLWLTNWLLRTEEEEDGAGRLTREIERLLEAAERYPHPLIMVTNEVGDGIVPSYPLGRKFRDEAGRLNARLARICERVFLVTAGIPIDLKELEFRFEDGL